MTQEEEDVISLSWHIHEEIIKIKKVKKIGKQI